MARKTGQTLEGDALGIACVVLTVEMPRKGFTDMLYCLFYLLIRRRIRIPIPIVVTVAVLLLL